MGAEPYEYFAPFDADLQGVLDGLRTREFEAGRYSGAGIASGGARGAAATERKPGPAHASIADAVLEGAKTGMGTRSILDIETVAGEPAFGVAAPLSDDLLFEVFGTDTPTRSQIEDRTGALFEYLQRGQCVYVIVYQNGQPSEVYFAGYSYD